MLYFSLNNSRHRVSFQEAVNRGLAPDKGLYFPESIPKLSRRIIHNLSEYEIHELAFQVIYPYVQNTFSKEVLRGIIEKTLNFPFPLISIDEDIHSLELFHGPTLAFKDVGAAFMAGCLGHFQEKNSAPVTVLVATSGDTGGAVARGFYKVPKVKVVILYPSGKVSELQEKQLTTLGGNIETLEIEGNFDDCQNLVKCAFLDKELQKKRSLTSANSINVARWLPQMFYYFIAYRSLMEKSSDKKIIFSVPSGNFGNLCAGILAAQMGLPIEHFVASTNSNDTIPRFMENGVYEPKTARTTLSNAMDVADPSNFVRILELYPDFKDLQNSMSAYRFTDPQTIEAIQNIWKDKAYMLDPHGAVGYLGLQRYLKRKNQEPSALGVFLETAHPVKFIDKIPEELRKEIIMPDALKDLMKKHKKAKKLSKDYENFRSYLLDTR
ncbi:threonine synthase [Bacteroidetes bacterium endosymbiont of Geopemphigus sp.]|uniref:threonine synthase n=1 Tax=Bacteroidetes bacterium endosymbiont of Geopemphigus sp. TaxID=2047937 RepID=UPI000CD28F69|nr:threonine synthase [Bacteroidetes bacterium endosymbiont of Geopemphigus sp.]